MPSLVYIASVLVAGAVAMATSVVAAPKGCEVSALQNIEAYLRPADQALASAEYSRANDLALRAIKLIGNMYYAPSLIDDTGQKLVVADLQESEGDLKHAANVRLRIAHDRLNSLKRKWNC